MKDQFSGTPNEDAMSHLNTFIELCDIQKKKICGQWYCEVEIISFLFAGSCKNLVFFFASQ